MVTASHPVFRFLLEETELNAAPVKNGPVTRPSKIPALSSKGEMWGRSAKLTIPPDTLTALFVTQLSPPKNTDKQFPLSQGRYLGPLCSGCKDCQSCLQYPVAVYPLTHILSGDMTSLWAAKPFTWQRRKGRFPQTEAKPGAATSSISWVKEFPSQLRVDTNLVNIEVDLRGRLELSIQSRNATGPHQVLHLVLEDEQLDTKLLLCEV